MRTLLFIALVMPPLFCIGCNGSPQSAPTKNIQVGSRLVILHPDYAEPYVNDMNRSRWFTELVDPTFSVANDKDVLEIDEKITDYILEFAVENDSDGPYLKTGLEETSSRIQEYFGQFFAVQSNGRNLMICIYSHIEGCDVDPERIAEYWSVPWVADGNGVNFLVYFDIDQGKFEHFHISGSQAGSYGDYPNWPK